jgi:hypothetical protein
LETNSFFGSEVRKNKKRTDKKGKMEKRKEERGKIEKNKV